MPQTETVETEILRRADMAKPGALTKFQERGEVGRVDISVGAMRGGVRFENMLQVMEFSKMMALSDIAVPAHLRGNPGACLAVTIQADEWGFSPFAVANKSFSVNNRLAYESQLIHAVIERRAPMDGRLRPEWVGDGPTRKCIIVGRLINEKDPFVWESPEIDKIKIKNSPEWTNNPDKQLFYHASRDWARIYVPDVLLGVYTRDELDNSEFGPNRARDVTASGLVDRLPEARIGGYDADGIARTLREAAGSPNPEAGAETPAERNASPEASQEVPVVEKKADGKEPSHSTSEPSDRDGYTAWAEGWIGRYEDESNAMARWDGERELRAACKVTVAERKRLEKKLKEKFRKEE
jgi:hypothetical protein